jgi:hypothetical protein
MESLLAETRRLVEALNDLLGFTGYDRPTDPVPSHLAYSDVLTGLRAASGLLAHAETGSPALWSELAQVIVALERLGPSISVLVQSGALDGHVVDGYQDLLREHGHVLGGWQAVARHGAVGPDWPAEDSRRQGVDARCSREQSPQ